MGMTPEFAQAFLKAQKEVLPAKKDTINPHFKKSYADLTSVWDACRAALHGNGISVIQSAEPLIDDGHVVGINMQTVLLHESGTFFITSCAVRSKGEGPQDYGGAIAYAKRYGLAAAVGVVAEEDDDANQSQASTTKRPQTPVQPAVKKVLDAFMPTDEAGWRRRIELSATQQSIKDDKQYLLDFLQGDESHALFQAAKSRYEELGR